MPNFKIIQDVADEARVKIFGSQDTALKTDASGDLVVTATADGLSVTGPPNGLIVTASASGLSVTGPINGLIVTATADGLSVTGPANGLIVTASAGGLSVTGPPNGLIVTAAAGGLLITSPGLPVISQLATTDVSYTATAVPVGSNYTTPTVNVLGISEWTFSVVNQTAATTVTAVLQGSPDDVNFVNNSAVTTLVGVSVAGLVPSVFFKYAQISYSVLAGTPDINFYFQGQL